ncbi:transmembrane protein, putative [Medicago truncatula]|uniref:Transmembrane protein, putative n=1 Tax=Medicago truncatula TaxID=3880 RepID=G7J8T1_MEDTR|nr:transmembrane protein, putative [Medicago truncatula]
MLLVVGRREKGGGRCFIPSHVNNHQKDIHSYLFYEMLVIGDNSFHLFMGWEGVSVASYLLICFIYFYNKLMFNFSHSKVA